jgi:hypothetical protein
MSAMGVEQAQSSWLKAPSNNSLFSALSLEL